MWPSVAKNRYIIWLHLLRLNPPTEGFPCDDLRQIFRECQRMAKVANGVEILPKIWIRWVERTNVTPAIAYSEVHVR